VQSPPRCDAREMLRAAREGTASLGGTRAAMGGNSVFMGQITQIGFRRVIKAAAPCAA
jgi:hypothetical protein